MTFLSGKRNATPGACHGRNGRTLIAAVPSLAQVLLPLFAMATCLATEVQNLPLLRLKMQGSPRDAAAECSAQLFVPAAEGASDAAPRPGTVKVRGALSRQFEKKSLTLKLKQDASWLGLREEKEWVLNAAFIDFSMMRHKLSYDLFRSLGDARSPRFAAGSRFIEVELNGHYHGVFLLMEAIKGSMLGLSTGDDKNPAVMYKAVTFFANFTKPGHAEFEQKKPDPDQKTFWGPLDDLNGFVSESSDQAFFDQRTGIGARIDVANAVDFHLFVLLTSNIDGISKNYLLVRDSPTPRQPAPKFFFVPWDYDATWGRNWDGSKVDEKNWLSNRLFDRLMSNSFYRPLVASRWHDLRARQFSEANILRMIEANVRTLGPAAARNELRWRNIDGRSPAVFSFAKDVAEMREWVPLRLRWLDGEIKNRTSPQASTK